jgi:hypothetical protein
MVEAISIRKITSAIWKSNFRSLAIFLVLASIGLWAGFTAVQGSVYSSNAQVFLQFLNGPDRVFFPIAVALVAGTSLSAQIADRYFVNTRTREDSRRRLTRILGLAILKVFGLFAGLTIVYAIAAFLVVPLVAPQAISPESYGFSGKDLAFPNDLDTAPLTVFLVKSLEGFVVVSALWVGFYAITFTLVTFTAVLLIEKSIIALSVPMLIYVGQSAIYQMVGLPAGSFIISAIHPSGLQHYQLFDSIVALVALFTPVLLSVVILILTSRRNARLS